MVTLSPQQFREITQRVPALVVSGNGHVEHRVSQFRPGRVPEGTLVY